MSNFFSAPSTPAKTDSERTLTTPSTGKTEINSPYDYEKQVDFEWDNMNKRRRNVVDDVEDMSATVMTDRYSRPIHTKENGVLVEVTTKTMNGGPYFYDDGEPVTYTNMKGTNLFADFDTTKQMKKSRTVGGKMRKSRKARKSVKRRKTMKKRKNKRKY